MRLLALAAWLALAAPAARAADFTPEELSSLYPYDLGPAEIDVSGYPKRQQENYQVFKNACSQCHTLARPINAPAASRKVQEYYVFRMRMKTQYTPGTKLSAEEVDRILDFLSYDSRARKVKGRKAFNALSRQLDKRFDETIAERLKRMKEGKN